MRARPSRTVRAALVCSAMLLAAPAPSVACGFHDPLVMEQAVLNLTYPDALYVIGTTWSLQQAGRLPKPDKARIQATGEEKARLESAAYWKATSALKALGSAMDTRQSEPHSVTIVLVGTMLWTRYEGGGPGTEMSVWQHAPGPEQGDLVLVTDEPTLHAIAGGTMRIGEAVILGAMRPYGTEGQVEAYLGDFGRIGKDALPRRSRPTLAEFSRGQAPAANNNQTTEGADIAD